MNQHDEHTSDIQPFAIGKSQSKSNPSIDRKSAQKIDVTNWEIFWWIGRISLHHFIQTQGNIQGNNAFCWCQMLLFIVHHHKWRLLKNRIHSRVKFDEKWSVEVLYIIFCETLVRTLRHWLHEGSDDIGMAGWYHTQYLIWHQHSSHFVHTNKNILL